jgi:hypothetical protein
VETVLEPFSENPLTKFDSACIDRLPESAPESADADDPAQKCVALNQFVCLASANARFGPLGWYLSTAAALDIVNWAYYVLMDSPFLSNQL